MPTIKQTPLSPEGILRKYLDDILAKLDNIGTGGMQAHELLNGFHLLDGAVLTVANLKSKLAIAMGDVAGLAAALALKAETTHTHDAATAISGKLRVPNGGTGSDSFNPGLVYSPGTTFSLQSIGGTGIPKLANGGVELLAGTGVVKLAAGVPSVGTINQVENGTNKLTVLDNGNVNVGVVINAPSSAFEVYDPNYTGAEIASFRKQGDAILSVKGNSGGTTQLFSIRNDGTQSVCLNTQNSIPLCFGVSTGTTSGSIISMLNITSAGRVGIGTNTATLSSMLQVRSPDLSRPGGVNAPGISVLKLSRIGTLNYSFDESAEFRIAHGGPSIYGSQLSLYVNGASNTDDIPDQHVMTWDFNGRVGIGVTNPSALFQVAVNGATCNGTSWTPASDERLKRDITPMTDYGLMTVMQLKPVTYYFTADAANHREIGFIAQDVQKIIPEVVFGTEGDLSKGESLGLSYDNMVAVLTKAIQEQQAQIDELRKTVEMLVNKTTATSPTGEPAPL